MSAERFLKAILVATALMVAVPAAAQTVSSADLQRLQDDVYQASSDVSRLRSTDANAAARLQEQLDDLRDEVTYLKVKLRKEGSISRSDYSDVRTRLQDLRARAHQDAGTSSSSSYPSDADRGATVPGPPRAAPRRAATGRHVIEQRPQRHVIEQRRSYGSTAERAPRPGPAAAGADAATSSMAGRLTCDSSAS